MQELYKEHPRPPQLLTPPHVCPLSPSVSTYHYHQSLYKPFEKTLQTPGPYPSNIIVHISQSQAHSPTWPSHCLQVGKLTSKQHCPTHRPNRIFQLYQQGQDFLLVQDFSKEHMLYLVICLFSLLQSGRLPQSFPVFCVQAVIESGPYTAFQTTRLRLCFLGRKIQEMMLGFLYGTSGGHSVHPSHH